jgi:hypothetical protein
MDFPVLGIPDKQATTPSLISLARTLDVGVPEVEVDPNVFVRPESADKPPCLVVVEHQRSFYFCFFTNCHMLPRGIDG